MINTALRSRLHSLWACLTDPRMDQCLLRDNVAPSRFLSDNNITLIFDGFTASSTAAQNLNKKSPVLFLLRPPSIITDHPIDLKDEFFKVPPGRSAPVHDPSPAVQVKKIFDHDRMAFYRGISLASYFDGWIINPHPLNVVTRGFQRHGLSRNIQWETRIYEYSNRRPNGNPLYAHLVLLGAQSCNGRANTICLGELTTIVTAMRCRAYQPVAFDEDAVLVGDVEQSEDGNPMPGREDELAFKDEERFPVIMVSLLGPRHVMVIYACMDDLKLSTRISELHEIQPADENRMANIASVLLSSPLVEWT